MDLAVRDPKFLPAAAARPLEPLILTLPGLDGSGENHWQSHWERLTCCRRADLPELSRPRLHLWVDALDEEIRSAGRPVILAAHSLGCLAVAWWSVLRRRPGDPSVQGALLVAPPDVDEPDIEPRIRDFRPVPQRRLPFRTLVVASRDDPFATIARSRRMADDWGSEFVDAGIAGHLNAGSGLGLWADGLRHLARLCHRDFDELAAELGLRTVPS